MSKIIYWEQRSASRAERKMLNIDQVVWSRYVQENDPNAETFTSIGEHIVVRTSDGRELRFEHGLAFVLRNAILEYPEQAAGRLYPFVYKENGDTFRPDELDENGDPIF